ncbi:YqhR family membrane protein [Siminovitchia sp. 179-K 8D1 HS]|uniref:YqhR family membrane protein n=1 Tax=Siminovitchia sp. 179-K 8D1 HS TaxID=3142385 RepID=UPI00399EFEA1
MANETYYNISLLTLAVVTGLVAGIFGGLMGYLLYYFNFTEISPEVILTPVAGSWKSNWIGIIIVSMIYGVISIIVALVYYALLRKKKSFVWGAVYGAALFIVIFFVLHPLYPNAKSILSYDINTILTGLTSFILYGVFIGYSISYEYEESLYVKK